MYGMQAAGPALIVKHSKWNDMQCKVTRRAILIGSTRPGEDYLRGVEQDLKHMRQFLLSDHGGHWYQHEIICLLDPSLEELRRTVYASCSDYQLVYFAGHGYTCKQRGRMLVLRDKPIADVELLNDSPRQLVTVDACRTVTLAAVSGIPEIVGPAEQFDGLHEARALFDEHIRQSDVGRLIVHATKAGFEAYETAAGGVFTRALLQQALSISGTYRPVSIHQLLATLPAMLRRNGNNQVPDIVLQEGNLTVPFAIATPAAFASLPGHARLVQHADTGDGGDAGGVGVLLGLMGLLGLLVLANWKTK